MEVPPGPLPLRPVRNADFKEVVLDVDGAPALRFASAYGFRNIQTLMRQMKRRRCAYDYVEVMACPSGDFLQVAVTSYYTAKGCGPECQCVRYTSIFNDGRGLLSSCRYRSTLA